MNLRDVGAVGDGVHDDTAALQSAIRDYKIIYVPSGRYLLTDTVKLQPDTVLVGLHPSTTQFVLNDESPRFNGQGAPVPMLLAPPSGTTSVRGIGLYTGGINSRGTALLWEAGEHSQVNDVRFLGGHGTNLADGTRVNPYNPTHSGDPDPHKRWDSQYPSLWVTNGGGGTFADIWTPDTFAQAGMMVSDTETPGRVYELSSEHHVRNEIEVRSAAHWSFFALQTEEEWGEGGHALPVFIQNSHDVLFTNMHSYRVVGTRDTLPQAVEISDSQDVRFRNVHIDSDSKYSVDNGISDERGVAERFREFSSLDVNSGAAEKTPAEHKPADVQRVVGNFYNISGAAVDSSGRVLFIDSKFQRIYRWSPDPGRLDLLRDAPLAATNLAVDQSGDVLVVSYEGNGTVYSFSPDGPLTDLQKLEPEAATGRLHAITWIPNDFWKLPAFQADRSAAHKPFQYVSPDGSTDIPAGRDFVEGQLYYGTKMADVLRSFALTPAHGGDRVYLTEEEENRTWVATLNNTGTLTDPQVFAERGGEGVTTDREGNVYVAAGNVYKYNKAGELLRVIHVPERPIDLVFGGPKRDTLFILARTSLYSWKP